MKILHLVHQYFPEHVGGTEYYTRWVAHSLSKRAHQVDIFYRRYGTGVALLQREEPVGVRVWAAQSGPMSAQKRFLATFGEKNIGRYFQQVVEQVQPDLVHIQHLMGLPVTVIDYLQRENLPFVITLHDYWWVCANAQLITNYSQQLCNGPLAYFNCARCALARANHSNAWPSLPFLATILSFRNRLLRKVVNSAQALITPTQFVYNWYVKNGIAVNRDRIRFVPHGLDLPPGVIKRNRQSNTPIRFAYIGGLSWQKGVHILCQAFSNIRGDAELWIAGDESADPDYVSVLRNLATPNVQFLGKLSREMVWETLSRVDVVVLPSIWYETFSLIVSEAFAAGVPVVASALGPLPDRVQDSVNGLLFSPADPEDLQTVLQRFLLEPDLLPRLQAGIHPVRTIDEYVLELEAIYSEVVG